MATTSRQNYRPAAVFEPFYTGGPARVSNDGTHLACACGGDVKDEEPITALAWSPDGKCLHTASRSLQQRMWDIETTRIIRAFRGHRAPVLDMAADATGALLASAGADRSVRVWDVAGGYCTHSFTKHKGIVLRVAIHPRELLVIAATQDAEVLVWDLVSKTMRFSLQGHFSAVTGLDISPNGWTLVTAGRDKVVMLWDLRTGSKLSTLPVHEAVEGVVWVNPGMGLPQGKGGKGHVVATAGEHGLLKFWHTDTARCLAVCSQAMQSTEAAAVDAPAEGGALTDILMVKGGTRAGVLCTTADSRVLLYQAGQDASPPHVAVQLVGNIDQVTDLRALHAPPSQEAAPAPSHLAVATSSAQVHVFEVATRGCVASLTGHAGAVLALDVRRGQAAGVGTLLATGSKDHGVRLWSVPEGRCVARAEGHIAAVTAVAFGHKDGSRVLVSAGADKILKVWDMGPAMGIAGALSKASREKKGSNKRSKDGNGGADEAARGGGVVQLQATAAVAGHQKEINAVAVSPNDALVATGSLDKTAKLWKLPDLVLACTLKGHRRGIWAVAFSPVDKAVATASGDKTLRLWSTADGSCLRSFEGHAAAVLRVTFCSGGAQLLSTGGDGALRLWDARSGEAVNSWEAHEDKGWALDCVGDGAAVVTGGGDGRVVVWEDCTAAEAAEAAATAAARVQQEQALSLAVAEGRAVEAAKLAFSLRQPGRLLGVVQRALEQGDGEVLAAIVRGCGEDDLRVLLSYTREWNTNSRTCHAAQALLRVVLTVVPMDTLVGLQGAADLLAGLEAYGQRHHARLERLQQASCVLDYMLGSMGVLDGAGEVEEEASQVATPEPVQERRSTARVEVKKPKKARKKLKA